MLFPNSPNCMHWLSAVFLYTDYNSIKLGETETVLRANMKPLLPFRKKKKKRGGRSGGRRTGEENII